MKRTLLAFWAILSILVFSTGAGAITIPTENYYGGTVVGYTVFNDVIGPNFAVDSLVATKDGSGKITVVLTGAYFSSSYATGTGLGQPGDLYISSTGWRTISSANNYDTDIFDPSLEGWNYVVRFDRTGNTSLYSLSGSYTATGSEGGQWSGYRTQQAYRGGYDVNKPLSAATSTLSGNTLTFIFDGMGLDPNAIGYHWTMACGNDVVEGGGTPVPEPGTLFLLGLGFLGVVVSRFRK